MNVLIFLLVLTLKSDSISCENIDYMNSWKSLESFVSSGVKQLLNTSMKPVVIKWLNNSLVDQKCSQSIEKYIDAISNMEYWAIKMFDSSGKIPSGLLEGTLNDMGSYDECLEISNASYCLFDFKIQMPKRKAYHSIGEPIGQYFANYSQPGKIFHHLSTSFGHYFYYLNYRIAICLPSLCSENDIQNIMKTALNKTGLTLLKPHCEKKINLSQKLKNLNSYQLISIYYVFTILLLIIIGTIKYSINGNKDNSIFDAFSLKNNFLRLISTNNQTETMTCLHGLRVFSIVWVVFGHCYGWISFQIFRRSFAASDIVTSFWFQPLMHGSLSVDTFFLISGLLTMYGSILHYKLTKKFNLLIFVLHRIWRFLPLLLLTLSMTFIIELIGSGPIWHETIHPIVYNCQKNWWKNILFINNLVDSKNICLLHTWYLGCDFHFYLLALVVILPIIYNYKKLAIINNCLLLSIGTLVTGIIIWKNGYPPTLLYAQPKVDERLQLVLDFYIKPYSHIGSYCIGLFLALIIKSVKTDKVQKQYLMQKKFLIIGWTSTAITILTILFAIYPWNKGSEPHPIISIIYGSLHRTLWSASIAWIIFVCVNGSGGFVNSILSWSPLIPLSRLTYSVYLTHPLVHWMKLGSIRERIHVNHYDGLYAFIPTLVFTFAFSLICSLLCESPLLAIEQKILDKIYPKYKAKKIKDFDLVNLQQNQELLECVK